MSIKSLFLQSLFTVIFTGVSFANIANKNTISAKNKISFTENKGQIVDQNNLKRNDVLFNGQSGRLSYFIKESGVSYQLHKVEKWSDAEDISKGIFKRPIETSIYRVDINWLNTNKNYEVKKGEEIASSYNYYTSSFPEGIHNVKAYKDVFIKNIYKGIDLHYYEKDGDLKYDYIVAPKTDYKKIQLQIEGAEKIVLQKDGSILIKTPFGDIVEGAPVVFQNGKQLNAKWRVDKNVLSFIIQNYNPEYELIIDPVTRMWGTYFGGFENEICRKVVSDNNNNIIIVGQTNSTSNIATSGSFQTTLSGNDDVFIAKFNPLGSLLWSTYFGSNFLELALSCAIDNSGNIYVSGFTESNSGITTSGSHQGNFGGQSDAFLVKFNSNGQRQWATYCGGSGIDYGYACSVDALGNVYLTGETSSSNNIATSGAFLGNYSGGNDAFLVKFNASGQRLWGTYFGGTSVDGSYSCATDLNNNVIIAGRTTSNSVATPGVQYENLIGNGFIAQFNSVGNLNWATYYTSEVQSCSTDSTGNIYIAGYTNSTNLISTPGAHQENYGGDMEDAYLAKFNNLGLLIWGTYYGGQYRDFSYSVTASSNRVYLSGFTTSSINIATSGAYQTAYGGGMYDAFLAGFDTSGVRQWGTYLGNSGIDQAFSVTTDSNGMIYLAGATSSYDSIATIGSHQSMFMGAQDAFLVKFGDCGGFSAIATTSINEICEGTTATVTVSASGGIPPYTGVGSFNVAGGNYTYNVTDNNGCVDTANIIIVEKVPPLQDVCMVTTDSITASYNIIVWEKPSNMDNIDSFFIYREITLNNYQLVGAVHKDSLSVFEDFGANPNSTSYKYKIAVYDTCSNIGVKGDYHNSIHLQYLGLGNFQWTAYQIENSPNPVASYNFYRDDNATGNFQLLQIIPGGNTTYTDINYSSFPNALYRVDVIWNGNYQCNPSRSSSITTSRSNIRGQVISSVYLQDVAGDILIYPNPSRDYITIVLPYYAENNVTIMDAQGKITYTSMSNLKEISLDLETFETGIYLISIENEFGRFSKKIIKQ
jgi:hypothetical protein